MTARLSWVTAATVAIVSIGALSAGSSTVGAQGRDRTPPTTPTNLRVTGMTPYSVSLAWNPSTDNSGSFTYTICCANVSSQIVPQTVTSVVYTAGLEAGRTFSLRIYARDAAGNYSKPSNTVTFTLPRDLTAPTKPQLAVTDVGTTHVSLSWSSSEEGPVWFTLFVDGAPTIFGTSNTGGTIYLLGPETTHTFTVLSFDFGGNASPLSDPVTVTTDPVNPNDHTAPTTPSNLRETHFGSGDGETELRWTASVDDFDPQNLIRYDIYVNGVFDHSLAGGFIRTTVYGVPEQLNTFEVRAIDTAGNESAPAILTAVIF